MPTRGGTTCAASPTRVIGPLPHSGSARWMMCGNTLTSASRMAASSSRSPGAVQWANRARRLATADPSPFSEVVSPTAPGGSRSPSLNGSSNAQYTRPSPTGCITQMPSSPKMLCTACPSANAPGMSVMPCQVASPR